MMAVTTGDEFIIPIKVRDEATAQLKKIQQIAAEMATVMAQLGVNASKAATAVTSSSTKIASSMKSAGGAAGGAGGAFVLFGQKIGSIPAKIFIANQALELFSRTFRTFATLGSTVLGPAIALEKGAATINAIVPAYANAQAKFSSDIINFQRLFGTEQQDLIEAYYKTLSSGVIQAADATKFLYQAQRLAIGGSTDLSIAVRALTSVIAAYDMQASDAARISDILTLAERNGQATMTDLALTIGDVAPLAYNMGVSLEEATSVLTAMTTAQQDTGQAMTYFRSILVSLMKQSESLADVIPRLKIDGKQFSGIQEMIKTVGLFKTIKAMIDEVGGEATAVGNLFGRQEGIQGIISIFQNQNVFSAYAKSLKEMEEASSNAGSIVAQAVDIQMKTVDRKLMIFKGTLTALMQEFGYKLLGMAASILTAMRETLDRIYPYVVAFGIALGNINWDVATAGAKEFSIAMAGLIAVMSYGSILVVAKWALMFTALIAFSTAIEYIYRNRNNLGAAFEYMSIKIDMARNALKFFATEIDVQFKEILNNVFAKFIEKMASWVSGFLSLLGMSTDGITKWSDEFILSLKDSGPDLLGQKEKIKTLNDEYAKLQTRLIELGKTVKTPMVFNFTEQSSLAFKNFDSDMAKAGTAMDKFFKDMEAKINASAKPEAPPIPKGKALPKVEVMSKEEIAKLLAASQALTELEKAYRKVEIAKAEYAMAVDERSKLNSGSDPQKIKAATDKVKTEYQQMWTAIGDAQAESYKMGKEARDDSLKVSEEELKKKLEYIRLIQMQYNAEIAVYDKKIDGIDYAIKKQQILIDKYPEQLALLEGLNELERTRNLLIDQRNNKKATTGEDLRQGKIKEAVEGSQKNGFAAFNFDQLELIGQRFGRPIEGSFKNFTTFMSGPMGMVSAAGMILEAFKAVVEIIANFPQKVADVFKSVTDISSKWSTAIKDGLGALKGFFVQIPKFLDMSSQLMDLGELIANAIGSGIERMFAGGKLGKAFGKFIEKGFEALFQVHLIKLVAAIIGALRKAILALSKGSFWKDFANGFTDALKQSINDILKNLGMKPLFKLPNPNKFISDLGKAISKASDQLFSVTDYAQAAKGGDLADKVSKAMASATIKAADYLKMAWKAYADSLKLGWDLMLKSLELSWKIILGSLMMTWEALKAIWNAVYPVLKTLWNALRSVFSWAVSMLSKAWEGAKVAFLWIYDNIITPIFDGMKAVWMEIWEKGIKPIYEELKKQWDSAINNVKVTFEVVYLLMKSLFEWLDTKIIQPLGSFFQGFIDTISALFTFIGSLGQNIINNVTTALTDTWNEASKAFTTLWNTLSKAFSDIWGVISFAFEGIKSAFVLLFNIFKPIFDALAPLLTKLKDVSTALVAWPAAILKPIYDALKGVFKDIDWGKMGTDFGKAVTGTLGFLFNGMIDTFNLIIDLFNSLVIPGIGYSFNIMGKHFSGDVIPETDLIPGKIANIARLASGGIVQAPSGMAYAAFGGYARGTDTVPAMLTPGEFVVNRNATKNNLNLLSSMNNSNAPMAQSGGASPIYITINAKTNLDADTIKREIVPEITRELKKQSQMGRYTISANGVR